MGTASSALGPDVQGFFASRLQPPQNDCCSICHDFFNLPCQANCAHWFCGDCILRVWHHTSAREPCKCPICRRVINLLIPSASWQREDAEARRIRHDISNYNRMHGGEPVGLLQCIRDMPMFLRRLAYDLLDPQRALPFMHRIRYLIYLLLTASYVLSPLDILPEAILGLFGLIDDVLVTLLMLFHVTSMYRTSLMNRHNLQD